MPRYVPERDVLAVHSPYSGMRPKRIAKHTQDELMVIDEYGKAMPLIKCPSTVAPIRSLEFRAFRADIPSI